MAFDPKRGKPSRGGRSRRFEHRHPAAPGQVTSPAPRHREPEAASGAPLTECAGILEVEQNGSGRLRDPKRHLVPRSSDPMISSELIRRHALRGGESITGPAERLRDGNMRLASVQTVEGVAAAGRAAPPLLEESTAIDPHEPLHFDTPGGPPSMRVLELFTPIGKGQRGLIVAPPRTGKTILLQQLAHGLAENHPEVYMIVLLIDERPEEVTEMRRNVRGDVFASSNDLDVQSHVRVARLVLERARRLVEMGKDIVILLDSITRLARAFNSFVGSSGRTMTGGLDIRAMQEPKQMFGAARNVEGGGSLTILGSALIDTGSRADNFIFEEFKGTGNMELVLNREMANMRIWPAIDLAQSGTRKEEKLLKPETLQKVNMLRRHLHGSPPTKQMTDLLQRMEPHKDIASFLASLKG